MTTAQRTVRHWSTDAIPPGMRFDYWLSTLQDTLWPVSDWRELSKSFRVQLREARLGQLSSLSQTITPHSAHRTGRDVERSAGDFYHLFFNDGPSWALSHRGRTEHVDRGAAILVGAEEHRTCVPQGFSGLVFKLPAQWLHSWVPDPRQVVGRQIRGESRWGRVLCPMLSQLTPELAAAPPVAAEALTDHLGVVLAMMRESIGPRARPDLMRKIQEQLIERRAEPSLTASDVATALNVPTRILHQTLGAHGTSFLKLLREARATT